MPYPDFRVSNSALLFAHGFKEPPATWSKIANVFVTPSLVEDDSVSLDDVLRFGIAATDLDGTVFHYWKCPVVDIIAVLMEEEVILGEVVEIAMFPAESLLALVADVAQMDKPLPARKMGEFTQHEIDAVHLSLLSVSKFYQRSHCAAPRAS